MMHDERRGGERRDEELKLTNLYIHYVVNTQYKNSSISEGMENERSNGVGGEERGGERLLMQRWPITAPEGWMFPAPVPILGQISNKFSLKETDN
jgi:hypothetical protein